VAHGSDNWDNMYCISLTILTLTALANAVLFSVLLFFHSQRQRIKCGKAFWKKTTTWIYILSIIMSLIVFVRNLILHIDHTNLLLYFTQILRTSIFILVCYHFSKKLTSLVGREETKASVKFLLVASITCAGIYAAMTVFHYFWEETSQSTKSFCK